MEQKIDRPIENVEEKIEEKKLTTNYYRGVDEKAYTISEEKE